MAKHYYISFNGVDYSEIFPAGSPVCVYSQWEGTRVWREELEQIKLVRNNNQTVFDTLESYFTDKTKFDTELEIEVYSGIRTTGVEYFTGLFSISDSDLDPELKVFTIKPRVNDDYYDLSEKYDVQFELDHQEDILEQVRVGYSEGYSLGTTWTNGPLVTATGFSTLVAGAGSITDATCPGATQADAINTLPVALAIDDIFILEITAFTGPTAYFNLTDIAGASKTDEGEKAISTGTYAWTLSGAGQSYLYLHGFPGTVAATYSARIIQNEYDMTDAGEKLITFLTNFVTDADFMNLSLSVVSTFLNGDALPSDAPSTIDTFMTANPSGNYATEAATNSITGAVIGLLRHWFGSVAESYKLSFKEITDQLRDILQVYWYIDADGDLRFEHERYFVKLTDDSTAITAPAASEVDKRMLKYEKGQIVATEQFTWPQADNVDFVGKDILYNNFETTINSKTYAISQITTDIKYVIDNITEASDSGLGLYDCNLLTGITGDDVYEITIATGDLSSAAISNANFSWANLHNDYWRWSRMSEDATINSVATTMSSSVRFLQQEGVRFHYSTAINPYTKIQTTLTGGAPVTIRRDLDTDYVEFVIAYDPYKL